MATRIHFGLLSVLLAATMPRPADGATTEPAEQVTIAGQVDTAIQEVLAEDGTPSASVAIV